MLPAMSTAAIPLPRAPRLPLVGSLGHYALDPMRFLETVAGMGPVVEMDFVRYRAWLINDPALVEQVFIRSAGVMQKDVFLRALKKLLGEGLLSSEGDFWKRQRRLIQPAFHRERIAGYGDVMVRCTAAMLDAWRDGQTFELHHAMMALTADIVTRALFGADAGDTHDLAACIDAVVTRFADPKFILVPALERAPLPSNKRLREVSARLDGIVRGFITRRREMGADAPQDDLLAMLLAAQDDDGARMSDQQVRDEVLILFLAGHETTALALSWTFHLLAQHPEVERALAQELSEVLGEREPTVADLPHLKLTERVVLETLRLYPPAWSLGREATEPFTLEGRAYPQGAWFWVLPWTLHRDPRTFADPLTFNPARWEDGLAKKLPKGAYVPFGIGPRVCIGNQFAMMEATLLLATIARRFSLRACATPKVEPEPSITLRFKHGIRMTAVARRPLSPA